MEIEGHPTEDIIEELQRRGALRLDGDTSGPKLDALRFLNERAPDATGFWMFVPAATYNTGFDEIPLR